MSLDSRIRRIAIKLVAENIKCEIGLLKDIPESHYMERATELVDGAIVRPDGIGVVVLGMETNQELYCFDLMIPKGKERFERLRSFRRNSPGACAIDSIGVDEEVGVGWHYKILKAYTPTPKLPGEPIFL